MVESLFRHIKKEMEEAAKSGVVGNARVFTRMGNDAAKRSFFLRQALGVADSAGDVAVSSSLLGAMEATNTSLVEGHSLQEFYSNLGNTVSAYLGTGMIAGVGLNAIFNFRAPKDKGGPPPRTRTTQAQASVDTLLSNSKCTEV